MTLWRSRLLLLIGLALGAVVVLVGPRVTGPYLPEALRGTVEIVEGEVIRTPHEPDRLPLTVVTSLGAIRAIFKGKIVEDPAIQSVRKTTPAAGPPTGAAGRTP